MHTARSLKCQALLKCQTFKKLQRPARLQYYRHCKLTKVFLNHTLTQGGLSDPLPPPLPSLPNLLNDNFSGNEFSQWIDVHLRISEKFCPYCVCIVYAVAVTSHENRNDFLTFSLKFIYKIFNSSKHVNFFLFEGGLSLAHSKKNKFDREGVPEF